MIHFLFSDIAFPFFFFFYSTKQSCDRVFQITSSWSRYYSDYRVFPSSLPLLHCLCWISSLPLTIKTSLNHFDSIFPSFSDVAWLAVLLIITTVALFVFAVSWWFFRIFALRHRDSFYKCFVILFPSAFILVVLHTCGSVTDGDNYHFYCTEITFFIWSHLLLSPVRPSHNAASFFLRLLPFHVAFYAFLPLVSLSTRVDWCFLNGCREVPRTDVSLWPWAP